MSKYRTRITRWDRFLSGVLCLALVLGLLPAAGLIRTAQAAEADHWAYPYAQQLLEWEVLTPASSFRLDAAATRAEFVAMCNRAFGFSRLGSMPFTDVPSSKWYAQDINIAYNAGYFKGKGDNRAAAADTLKREDATVLLARIMRLQETVGESLGFTDSRDLKEWSRGLVAAAAAQGIVGGYTDGSFRPANNITRGELAKMLVYAIGNPVNKPGVYKLNGGEVYGNVTISSSNVTLRNTVIMGNLYITGGVDLGNVLLENVTVIGQIVVSGGGESNAAQSSVILRNVEANELVVDSMVNQYVTISAYGFTNIPVTSVRSDTYLEDASTEPYGLQRIELVGESGTKLNLAGDIKEVINKTPFSVLALVKGSAKTVTIDEEAKGSHLVVGTGTRIDVLNLDVATLVTGDSIGQGDIIDLNIGAAGCEVDILPEHVNVRADITASIDGNTINSESAASLSAKPRFLAGYPTVSNNLTPTTAEGLYAVNKPGTVYWAVSATADGSVKEKDLLSNPPYGGNILRDEATGLPQSGSFSADTGTDYARLISGLEPDNSYYISAILVDERGTPSPLKVFSFSTPDNTTPAFVEGYPYMSKVSCEIAQVTAMTNKSCTLYWVLLPAGVAKPTPQNFRTNNFGANYGYGTMPVTKNVPTSIQVNTTTLPENTGFDLYLWLTDGTLNSDVVHVLNADTGKDSDPSFYTPDETAPVVSGVMQTNYDLPDAIEFTFAIDEAPATLYWAVVAEANETFIKPSDDLSSLNIQLKVEFGTGAIVSGKKDAAGPGVTTEVKAADFANKLKYSDYGTHNFKLYYVAKDAAGNYSDVGFIIVHTADNDPPTVILKFSDAMYNTEEDRAAGRKPRPQANSDLILVFSEQVKGDSSENADTFVDLYDNVATYKERLRNEPTNNSYATMLNYYKDVLAEELGKHIALKYVESARNQPELKAPTANSPLYGWLDLREAVVELQKDGTVTLTLPGGEGGAVHLGGGMEYYFELTDIFDDSYTANLLVRKDDNGKIIDGGEFDNIVELEHFTTIYAQVWLEPDEEGLTKIDVSDPNYSEHRLDIVIDVTPTSVNNSDVTDCWDMVLWSDTSAQFYVYRRVSTGTGTDNKESWGNWELVSDEIRATANTAISLSAHKSDNYIAAHGQYEPMSGNLEVGKNYQYGIRFTRVGTGDDAALEDPKAEPQAWGSLVTMKFSLVAGSRYNITQLSGSVDRLYTRYVQDGTVSEIGSAYVNSTTESILIVEKQFTDKRPPAFQNNSPTFTPSSSTITMSVYLNRTGILYYVAIPADELAPAIGGTLITAATDGRGLDENADGTKKTYPDDNARYDAVPGHYNNNTANKTYIPLNGIDRDHGSNKDYIYFMTGATSKIDPKTRGVYSSPIYDDIFDSDVYTANSQYAAAGSFEYTAKMSQNIIIAEEQHNLKPETWYYVYIVLRSDSGTFDDVVQVYRVKTDKVTPPAVIVNRTAVPESVSGIKGGSSTTGVSMTVNNRGANSRYDNPMLYYAVARKDDLPSQLTTIYDWSTEGVGETGNGPVDPQPTTPSGSKMSVLDAIITKWNGTNQSYFDHFAGSTLKNWVRSYITEATTNNQYGSSLHGYDAVNENYKLQECLNDMQQGGEYVMLVCARHYYSTESDGTQYGFAAAQGLFKPDGDPPKFIGATGLNAVTIDKAYNRSGVADYGWGSKKAEELVGYTFDCSFTIAFDKAIYTYDGGVLKQIVAKKANETLDTSKYVDIMGLLNASNKISSVGGSSDNTSFTLNFSKITSGQTITLTNIYNSSGVKSPYTLTLVFMPTTTMGQVYPDTFLGSMMLQPSFNVSWK